MRIWVLLSIENKNDHAESNFSAWWPHKPSVGELKEALGLERYDNFICYELLEGLPVDIDLVNYRLEEIEEGRYIDTI